MPEKNPFCYKMNCYLKKNLLNQYQKPLKMALAYSNCKVQQESTRVE